MFAKLDTVNQIKYRQATRSDALDIADLHAESWRANYRGEYRDEYLDGDVFEDRRGVWRERLENQKPNQYVVVAESGGEVIGFACVYGGDDPKWGSFLDNIHVVPGLHGKGIGAGLMKNLFEWCSTHYPEDGLYLWVLDSNKRAQKFYSSLGAVDRGGEISEPAGGGEIHGRRFVWHRLPRLRCASPRK